MSNTESGNFSAVPHEMTDFLMQLDLTARELRVILFFIRELQGYQLLEKIVKTEKICKNTKIQRQHVTNIIKSLIRKGIIERDEINANAGEYNYRFRLETFGRIHATETVNEHYFYGGKVIHNKKEASPSQLRERNQVGYGGVTNSVTPDEEENPPSEATRAAPRRSWKPPKDILKIEKDILRETKKKIEESFTLSKGEMGPEDIRKRKKFLSQQMEMIARGSEV